MKFNPLTPHNELPLLPPKETIETTAILKKTITAGRALAELKGIGSTIPNQSILINTITLQEAKSSSEIENIVTTNDALFKAFTTQSPQVDAATKEVLRYREALWEAFSTLKSVRSSLPTSSLSLSRSSNKTRRGYGTHPELQSPTHQQAKSSIRRLKANPLFATS